MTFQRCFGLFDMIKKCLNQGPIKLSLFQRQLRHNMEAPLFTAMDKEAMRMIHQKKIQEIMARKAQAKQKSSWLVRLR